MPENIPFIGSSPREWEGDVKRLIALVIVIGLVGGYVGTTGAAAKKKKKKLVPVEAKFFLRDDNGCEDPNYLSKEDGTDNGCWQLDSFLNEAIINQAGLLDKAVLSQVFETRDGVPLVLDATKALTGEIHTYSASCVDATIPCAPTGVGAGQASIDITITGVAGGEEVLLGEQTETFVVAPGGPHKTDVSLELDDALNKKKFDSLKVAFYPHGAAVFHSGVEMDNPASFITVPALAKKK